MTVGSASLAQTAQPIDGAVCVITYRRQWFLAVVVKTSGGLKTHALRRIVMIRSLFDTEGGVAFHANRSTLPTARVSLSQFSSSLASCLRPAAVSR